jgi:hypothetical protein
MLPLSLEREVDDHDAVLLDDTDQQDDANDGDHIQVLPEEHQREQCAHTRGGQCRKNRDRMDKALVKHTQNDVDRHQSRHDQEALHSKESS